MIPEKLFDYLKTRDYKKALSANLLPEVEISYWLHDNHSPVVVRHNKVIDFVEIFTKVDPALLELAF